MDISKLAMEDGGVWMDVMFDDMKQDARILLAGSNSDQYAQYEKKAQKLFMKKGNGKIDPAELQKLNLDKWIACTLDWEGFKDGETELKCTVDNKRKIYSDRKKYKWLHDQVEEFINEDSNFLSVKSMED